MDEGTFQTIIRDIEKYHGKYKLKERYYWPKMKDDIKSYIQTCDQYQRRGKTTDENKLHSIKIKELFYQWGIDIVGPLTETSRGNKYIVVAIDYFTKYPEARALANANARNIANFLYEDIICRHGCLRKIISDRGTYFNNQVIENLLKRFKIRHNLLTSYHPKTNGLVERFNKILCESLAKLNEERENWDEY